MKNKIEKFGPDYFDGKTSNYSEGYGSLRMQIKLFIRSKALLSFIKKRKKSGKLLDVGCAYGYFANVAQKEGFDSFGLDISKHAVGEAQKRFPSMKVVQGDIEKKIEFKNNFFDVVTAFDVLEHCKDLRHALNEIKRVLKRNGILFATLPSTEVLSPEKDRDKTHLWHLSSKDWSRVIEKEGFSLLEDRFYPEILKTIKPIWTTNLIIAKKE